MAIDMGSITALVSSVQAAAEITKGMVGLRDAAMIQAKVIELNGVIISAQSSALAGNYILDKRAPPPDTTGRGATR